MRIALLIVTYTSSIQTERMIRRLNNGHFDFYIHLDKKVGMATHENLFNIPNVYFIKNRIDIHWGGFSTAKAGFSCVNQVIATGIKYDYIELITGQDYPIKPASYIVETLRNAAGKQFIENKSFDDWLEAYSRVNKYHFTDMKFRGRHRLADLVNRFIKRGKVPMGLKLYGPTTFWTLTPGCAYYAVNFVESHKKLYRFLKYTWGTDEFIIQTILMNSHYKDQLTGTNHSFADWSAGGSRPKMLGAEDFDNLVASEKFFARKMSIDHDEKIFDRIDAYCDQMEAAAK